MYQPFYNPNNMIYYQNFNSIQHTQITLMAYVDAIIPQTPRLAAEYGKIQYFGALDLYVDDYVIMSLNHNDIPLAKLVAEMLDLAAEELITIGIEEALDFSKFPGGGTFSALAPMDRIRTLTLLEKIGVNPVMLPIPFQNNPGLIVSINGSLNRLTMMGYYSEWSGYGSTRLEAPNHRKLEYYPLSWQQVGYPGPSLGYRALRIR